MLSSTVKCFITRAVLVRLQVKIQHCIKCVVFGSSNPDLVNQQIPCFFLFFIVYSSVTQAESYKITKKNTKNTIFDDTYTSRFCCFCIFQKLKMSILCKICCTDRHQKLVFFQLKINKYVKTALKIVIETHVFCVRRTTSGYSLHRG